MRKIKVITTLIVSLLIVIMCINVLGNYSDLFKSVDNNYGTTAINLDSDITSEELANILIVNGYTKDSTSAQFISQHLTTLLKEGKRPATLSDLNKRAWQIPAVVIDSIGSEEYRDKLATTREMMGMDSTYYANTRQLEQLSSTVTINADEPGEISVKVLYRDEKSSSIHSLLGRGKQPSSGVVVRLSEQYLDSLYHTQSHILAYAITDKEGKATFKGLDVNKSYSVLPIQRGYEYGTSQGTIGGNLASCDKKGKIECVFTQEEHKVRVFDTYTLQHIKANHTLTVRSPQEYKFTFILHMSLFILSWWLLAWVYGRKRNSANMVIPTLMMLLTGLCAVMMFSMGDPLMSKLYGVDMARGIIVGVIIMILLQGVNFKKLYQNSLSIDFDIPLATLRWVFLPFRSKVSRLTRHLANADTSIVKKILSLLVIVVCLPLLLLDLICLTRLSNKVNSLTERLPKGAGYMLLAILLTVLLFTPLGVAVGGMRVNLNLGIIFQPSEITKYLIIFFMAAFFSVNADKIVRYSEKGNIDLTRDKLKLLTAIIIGLVTLILLYLLLGDMGPAMVLTFTFIILYSIIKSKVDLKDTSEKVGLKRILTCDTAMLLYGVASFILLLYVGHRYASMWLMAIVWLILWVGIGLIKRRIFESAILFNLIISAFIFGASILNLIPPLHNIADRLESRSEMCTNTWGTLPINGQEANPGENTQVAEGLWGLASGGLSGQGLGNGAPDFIPAFHTDMILESMGEQIGFLGLLLIIIILSILLRRTILVGYKTAHPFTFYLCLGIAIVTAVQFIIIALGSTGVIPLTGVTVPFFSYGKVSMILNLMAFGVVLSIARHNETETTESEEIAQLQHEYIAKYNYSISLLCWAYCLIAAFIVGVFFNHQVLQRDEILVKPVYVNNINGIPIINYNPRINQIVQNLPCGNIIDRNGVIVATSDPSQLQAYSHVYDSLGLDYRVHRLQARYYPFDEHLFFMTGNLNNQIYFGSDNRGYMAEASHLEHLRGYDNTLYDNEGNKIQVKLSSQEYRPDKYFDNNYSYTSQYNIQLRDYNVLLPYIKDGLYSSNASQHDKQREKISKKKNINPQDIQLTVDAQLQTDIQNRLALHVSRDNNLREKNNLRISVVILDAHNGDLLTSACHPLPDYQRLLNEGGETYKDFNHSKEWKAYTDMDLGLMFNTVPGSTAKVMSSIAGLNALGAQKIDSVRFMNYTSEQVGSEYNRNKNRYIGMNDAIAYSSNNYFIKLVNEYDLYDELCEVYGTVGARIGHTYENEKPQRTIYSQTYGLLYEDYDDTNREEIYQAHTKGAVEKYNSVKKEHKTLNKHSAWYWAWGQGTLDASPLAMARVASIVANKGKMPVTRYTLSENSERETVDVMSPTDAQYLKGCMMAEASRHSFPKEYTIAGKTGTAERPHYTGKSNDTWYICSIDNATISRKENGRIVTERAPIAIAIRMERLNEGETSGISVRALKEVVIPALVENGYLK